jgi:tRNA A-37 threonylcarbamoyl transferase component Bud32
MSADHNLLFGILALQNNFVSRDGLVEAMNAWVLARHRPLGELLRERGALGEVEHALLGAIVEHQLAKHRGDPARSLAALDPSSSVRSALAAVPDPEVQASLAGLATLHSGATTDHVRRPGAEGLRYRVLRPHARGGLGEVFVAEDTELHREAALKEIQPQHADNPSSRGRFLLEAEVTGRLEHPGIVPVYGLGHYADGRPFYAMRFVKGDNLKHAIDRFHGSGASFSSVEFSRLLRRFLDVCNAVAYAHARGVLHRDLKPGNVMLGEYGETLVIDWGLAKVVGRSEPKEGETTLRPSSGSDVVQTAAGSAIGTPSFMSPEQAEGRLEALGPATDVYSLGATLYCLLTGRPPVPDGPLAEVLEKVRRGDIPPAGQVRPGVPKALAAVCAKAMALQPGVRYASALALARDVERFLADEPVAAYREPLRVRAGRWVRRHQALTAALAAGVLVATLLGGAGALWSERQRGRRQAEEALRRQEADAAASSAMGQARLLLEQARKEPLGDADRFREALAAAEKARELARTGGASEEVEAEAMTLTEALKQEVDGAARDRTLLAALLEVHGPQEGQQYRKDEQGMMVALAERSADEQYRDAFRSWGLDVDATPAAAAAAKLRARPAAVVVEVVAALDAWADERRLRKRPKAECDLLMNLAQALDDDPGSKSRELRALLAGGDLGRERALGMLSLALRPVPVPFDAG